jgi:hypothetical protein
MPDLDGPGAEANKCKTSARQTYPKENTMKQAANNPAASIVITSSTDTIGRSSGLDEPELL